MIRDPGYTTLGLRPLKKWTRENDRSRREVSNGGLESFWDAQGVEIEAKQFFDIPAWHNMMNFGECIGGLPPSGGGTPLYKSSKE